MQTQRIMLDLDEFLRKAKGSRYDMAAVVYDKITMSDTAQEALAWFLQNADTIESSDELEVEEFFSASRLVHLNKEYNDLINGLLNKLVSKQYEEKDFYAELWKTVFASDLLFENRETKIYALGRIWSDGLIPYFQVNAGLKMSDEDFSNTVEKIKRLLQETIFIMNYPVDQRTECSSRLLEVLNRCENDQEKSVAMAQILTLAEKKALKRLMSE